MPTDPKYSNAFNSFSSKLTCLEQNEFIVPLSCYLTGMDLTYPDGNTNGASCITSLSKVAIAASPEMSATDSNDIFLKQFSFICISKELIFKFLWVVEPNDAHRFPLSQYENKPFSDQPTAPFSNPTNRLVIKGGQATS